MLKRKLREGTDSIQDFVRDKFVLRNRGIDMPFKKFYTKYTMYCTKTCKGKKAYPKSQLSERLKKREKFVNLTSTKDFDSGQVKFALVKLRLDKGKDTKTIVVKARFEDLLERWTEQHYIHETDEVDLTLAESTDTYVATDTDADTDADTVTSPEPNPEPDIVANVVTSSPTLPPTPSPSPSPSSTPSSTPSPTPSPP